MAHTTTPIRASLYEVVYTVAEAAGAAGAAEQRDVLTDMAALLTVAQRAASPLYTLLNNSGVAFTNQAAARTAVQGNLRISLRPTAIAIGAGGTGVPVLNLDPNVSGAAVGNFRLDIAAIKQHNDNTGSWVVTIEYRHSIEA